MNITLTENHEAWIAAQVAYGVYESPDEAVQQLIDQHLLSKQTVDNEDITWMKPLVDAAMAQVERGEFVTLEDHEAHMDAHMRELEEKYKA